MMIKKIWAMFREKTSSLKGFLIYGAVIGTIIMSLLVYTGVSWGFQWYVAGQASERTEKTAELTAKSLYLLMKKGWNQEGLQEFLQAGEEIYEYQHISISFFGRNDLASFQSEDSELTFLGTESKRQNNTISYSYPHVITSECRSCHVNEDEGNLMGVLTVTEDLEPILKVVRRDTLLYLLLLFPFPVLGAVVISRFLTNRIDNSLEDLQSRIKRINRTDDLRFLETNNINLPFDEIDAVYQELRTLARRVRTISVDKDILEFEVRLLEKFIITSEVVKDWKEHVNRLLIEINRIIDVHVIFSLFKVDTEDFVLEVFWLHEPSQETVALVEQIIREQLKTSEMFGENGKVGLQAYHNIAHPDEPVTDLDEESINFQTKSLFLDTPRIGGIVGIGVSSRISPDSTRMLVIEGVLTTLLNVIGSVKAVYKYTKELEYFATRDPLTNLYTQRVFWELLEYEVHRAHRHNYKFAVIVIDLDDFKLVNDLYGHLIGDRFLQETAMAIRDCLRKDDILSRYGGDEYAIILPYADEEQAFSVASRIIEALQNYSLVTDSGQKARTTASLGIAIYPDHGENGKDLFLIADNMMYKAKSRGKDQIGLPSNEDIINIFKTIEDKHTLLIEALEENKIHPYFQPIVDINTGKIAANEVLMRIDLPDEIMSAGDFIETAESMGIINRLDFMLMEKALAKASQENYDGLLFFNLSPKALIVSDFLFGIRALVREYGIEPAKVVFEITERDTVKNLNMLSKFVKELKREGFQFAIDDFGSGFSSFQYIKRLPIDLLKIEGDFIRSLPLNGGMDRAIVMSIVTLARELGITTVAEFVENEEVYEQVKALGIDYGQGYHIGRPAPHLKE